MDLIVSVPNDLELASSLGKKGTTNGITFFNRLGNPNIVFLAPTAKEDSFNALMQAVFISDIVLLSTKKVDSLTGEVLVACDLLGKDIVATDENDISAFVKGLSVNVYTAKKEELISKIEGLVPIKDDSLPVKIVLDRAFKVKGVGDVALGFVRQGVVKAYDKLVHSSGKEVLIKHIQSHDIDINAANAGARVGLALKGIESDEIEKGDILSDKQVKRVGSGKMSFKVSNYTKESSVEGNFWAIGEFSVSAVKVESNNFSFSKMLPAEKGSKFILVRKEVPRAFAVGTVEACE